MDQLTLSCPRCAQPVAEGDLFCEECGTDLVAARGGAVTDPRGAVAAPAVPAAVPAPAPPPAPAWPVAPHSADEHGPEHWDDLPAGHGADGSGGSAGRGNSGGSDGSGDDFALGGPGGSGTSAPAAAPATAGPGTGGPTTTGTGQTGDFVLAAPLLATELPDASGEDDAPRPVHPAVEPRIGTPAVPDTRLCVGCGAQRIDSDGYCELCGRAQPRPRDHQERALASVCGVSDRGHRHHRNEDAFAVAATSRPDGGPAVVAVVCDGVSSATRPDEASQAAADCASESLLEQLESGVAPETAMHTAILAAAERVDRLAEEFEREPSRNSPACTIVSAIATDGQVTLGWVGDSRGYWFPDDRSRSVRLTVDDSWATRMVAAGLMSEAEAFADPRAHAITGWLGADAVEVEPHTLSFAPDAPGIVLICTDGLWNYSEAAPDLAKIVPPDARTRPLEAAQTLVRYACDRGGHDNVTVAVLPMQPTPPRPEVEPDHAPTLVPGRLDVPTIQLREGES
ncbi:PP2C family serine/threonine-protein phosphatase [Streptacidiphilus fuscans]|uniref:Protein phosphatase 2C domain-containing protein n=1 Tax=Streptacidiphilus fuscans TaxID=2789292 RepID=A0A931FE95_9ACTN|nr:protein phosphatase 2C domain-containing protein [Streptacidiphilus fuscans]MBF9070428.1 protein phosphatase 2C domain-containing protein [Streptacidiphilus fuscans]